MRKHAFGWVATFFFLAPAAGAVDGVVEINQACVSVGCFSGDLAGWPVFIDGSAGRSYRLTGDLTVPTFLTTAIVVASNDVGIDLNNFAIVRAGCEDGCEAYLSSGYGVFAKSEEVVHRGVSVKNGSVIGMGNEGIFLGPSGEVTEVRVAWSGDHGIYVGQGGRVEGNTVYGSVKDGIHVEAGTTVTGNTSYSNGQWGILVTDGSTVSGNSAYGNGAGEGTGFGGIDVGSGNTVSGNTASGNTDFGIRGVSNNLISGNTSVNNGHGIYIQSGSGSAVQGNTASGNSNYGLLLNSSSAYLENVMVGNGTAAVLYGVNRGGNFCSGTGVSFADCP